jgi:hypothetical protein
MEKRQRGRLLNLSIFKEISMWKRIVLVVSILTALVSGLALPIGFSTPKAVAQSGSSTNRAEALVIVNSTSASFADFQHYIQPYLDHFGIPYSTLDIATTPITSAVGDYAVIIVGHKQLDVTYAYLSPTEQSILTTAVTNGTGLVNFDNDLSVSASPRYPLITNVFGFTYHDQTIEAGVSFATAHYITQQHATGSIISTGGMTLAGITPPADATLLATSNGEPFLITRISSQGHAVQWTSYDWMSDAVKGTMYGLDDLVWRSLVWAARKPFVLQGLPPFVTMRVDDVVGPVDWIHTANDFGIKPWAGLFINDISDTTAADLSNLTNSGLATASIHAFAVDDFFYFDHTGSNFPDAVVTSHFVTGTQWHTAHNIPISKYVVPHYYEIGNNAFVGLSGWGVEYLAVPQAPGGSYATSTWLNLKPFRLYENGNANDQGDTAHPLYYADYVPISGHPEYNNKFFDCMTEIRDDGGYEWYPDNGDINGTVDRGTRHLTRALNNFSLATLFTHEPFILDMTSDNWRLTLQRITSNIADYHPEYVMMDYACQYVRAIYDSNITTAVYDPASRVLTTTLAGKTDLPTRFYIFSDQLGEIQQSEASVPAFNGLTQVVVQLPRPVNIIVVSPASTTVTTGFTQQFVAQAYDDDNNPIPNIQFHWSVAHGGGAIGTNGLFTAGFVPGTYPNTIVASLGSLQATASVTVYLPVGPQALWDLSATPEVEDVTDDQPIELGVKFYSDIDGFIIGLRFYKGDANVGPHVGHLWTESGSLLASVTFSGETASGWQTATLSSPVHIISNTIYVASYYSPSGYFPADYNYFTTPRDRIPLHAPAGMSGNPNGVYRYGSGFPSAGTFYNYWIDPIFNTNTGPLAVHVQSLTAAPELQSSMPIVTGLTLLCLGIGLTWKVVKKL